MGERGTGEAHRRLRVAYIAYHFPPLGGAGTQRSLKFVANLPSFGVDPIVVTGSGTLRGRWTPQDDSLIRELPAGVDVLRVPGPEPPSSMSGWTGRKERWLLTRSKWVEWWEEGLVGLAAELGDVDVVYASMSPFATAAPTAAVAEFLGVPWAAGLRDPWALDEMMAYPTRAHRAADARKMRRTLSSAAAVIMTAPEAARRLAVSFPELADRTVTITNGFDAADFAGRVPERTDDKFRIVHSGYLHTGEGDSYGAWMRGALGGEILGVDTSTRSHVYLLETVRGLMENEPSLRGVIEVHLAGVTSEADRAAARDYDFVRFAGYLPHAESVALIRSADLLFLPMQNLRAGARAGIIPGKTYEYLATGNPILAAVPEGDARDIVRQAGTGLVCDPDDVAVMSTIIREQVRRWRHGAPSPPLDERYVTRFERQTLTATLAGVFTRVARREPVKDADGFAGERASVRLERVG